MKESKIYSLVKDTDFSISEWQKEWVLANIPLKTDVEVSFYFLCVRQNKWADSSLHGNNLMILMWLYFTTTAKSRLEARVRDFYMCDLERKESLDTFLKEELEEKKVNNPKFQKMQKFREMLPSYKMQKVQWRRSLFKFVGHLNIEYRLQSDFKICSQSTEILRLKENSWMGVQNKLQLLLFLTVLLFFL